MGRLPGHHGEEFHTLKVPAGTLKHTRIALVAGEASGDQLGAALMERLRQRYPDASFAGIGGKQMKAAGMDAWWDAGELSLFGLFEVLSHLPRLLRLRRELPPCRHPDSAGPGPWGRTLTASARSSGGCQRWQAPRRPPGSR